MVSHHISNEGVGAGVERCGKKERKKKSINHNHLPVFPEPLVSKAGRSCKMATEALPVRELSSSCARGPNKLY